MVFPTPYVGPENLLLLHILQISFFFSLSALSALTRYGCEVDGPTDLIPTSLQTGSELSAHSRAQQATHEVNSNINFCLSVKVAPRDEDHAESDELPREPQKATSKG